MARLLGLRRSHGQPAAAITHSLERRAPPKNRTSEAKIDRSPDERTADELAGAGKHSSKKLWRILGRRNLPVAREAHERLQFIHVHETIDQDRNVMAGDAREKNAPDHVGYADWSAKIVREELHKAGWRLADLLQQTLTSTSISAPSASH